MDEEKKEIPEQETNLKDAFKKSKETGSKVSEESAIESVEEMLKEYRVKFKHIVSDQGKDGAETWKNKIVEAFMDGSLETRRDPDPEKGFQIIQNTSRGKTLVYSELTIKASKAYAKERDTTSASFAMMAVMAGKGVAYFEKKANFSGGDLRLLEAIAMLFLF